MTASLEKTLTFRGTEKQITEVLQPLSLLPTNQIDFMKKALRSNLNNLQINENIYLNRLKEQYKAFKENELKGNANGVFTIEYYSMRLFCLDTQLVSFNDIEMLEFEINQSF